MGTGVSIFKRMPKMPDPSRFDKLDDETLYLLVEQAFGTAVDAIKKATKADSEQVIYDLAACDTALTDANMAVKSLLRRRIALKSLQ